jgi:hypothetical protein
MEETPLKFVNQKVAFVWKNRGSVPASSDFFGSLEKGEPCIVLDNVNPESDYAFIVCRLGVCYIYRGYLE